MGKFYKKTLLDAPLEAVWAYHDDIERGLTELSPPGDDVQVTKADKPAVGAEVTIRVRTPVGRQKWVAKYTEYRPPHGEVPQRRAWFVDEQIEGPFKKWIHRHRFEETVDEGRTKVWAIDDVRYTPPLGPLGWVADRLLLRRKLAKAFDYRHKKLREVLSRRPKRSSGASGM